MVRKRWKGWKEENNKDEREVKETILRELKEEKEQRVWYKKWDGRKKSENRRENKFPWCYKEIALFVDGRGRE